jgi:hypothetical protein
LCRRRRFEFAKRSVVNSVRIDVKHERHYLTLSKTKDAPNRTIPNDFATSGRTRGTMRATECLG